MPKRNPTTEPASSATRATNDPIFPNMAPGVPRRAAVYARRRHAVLALEPLSGADTVRHRDGRLVNGFTVGITATSPVEHTVVPREGIDGLRGR